MPKKLKLHLSDLKIQSFVTSLENDSQNKVMGGLTPATCPAEVCSEDTACQYCPDTNVECQTNTCNTDCGTCTQCTCIALTACKSDGTYCCM